MQPYQMTHSEWQEGVFFKKELTAEEKDRLVQCEVTDPGPEFSICKADLDSEPVFAVAQKGKEPFDSKSQKNLSWTKIIPTGRKSLTAEQHRTYVEQAVLLGKDVPLHVMGSYPDLMPLQGEEQ